MSPRKKLKHWSILQHHTLSSESHYAMTYIYTHHVACIQSSTLTNIHVHTCAYMHTYTPTYLCTHMHTYITLYQFSLSNQMYCEDCGCTTYTLRLRHYKCLLCRTTIVYVGLLKTKTYKLSENLKLYGVYARN